MASSSDNTRGIDSYLKFVSQIRLLIISDLFNLVAVSLFLGVTHKIF